MVDDDIESKISISIPKNTQIQDLLDQDNDWTCQLNPLIFVDSVLRPEKYNSGFLLVRKYGFKSNDIVYDVAARHVKKEKKLMEHYTIPIFAIKENSSEEMFKIALEMLCEMGKRRTMVYKPDNNAPFLVDTYFDGSKFIMGVSPYLCLDIDTAVNRHPEEGKRLEKIVNRIVQYSRRAE